MLSKRVQILKPSLIREIFNRRRPTTLQLSLGEPSISPEPELLERAVAKLKAGPQGYTMNQGLVELRAAIARHHALPGRDEDNVIACVGSEEAIFLAMTCLLDAGDEILVPDPGYPAYVGIAGLLGAQPVGYPIRRETGLKARADEIEKLVTERTKVILVNGPSNPFGMSDEREDLVAIAKLAEHRGLAVISDEVYRDLYYGSAPPPSITAFTDRSVLVSGLSKSCAMTGMRLGYLIAPAEMTKQTILAHQLMVTATSRIAQLMALEVFLAPEYLRKHVPYYAAAREALVASKPHLPEAANLWLGDGSFYAVLDVSRYVVDDPMPMVLALLDQEDVAVVPGTAFGPSGRWFWRISYAAGAEATAEGMRRIGRFLSRQVPAA